jgi:Mg-chelatase subunit ChlD
MGKRIYTKHHIIPRSVIKGRKVLTGIIMIREKLNFLGNFILLIFILLILIASSNSASDNNQPQSSLNIHEKGNILSAGISNYSNNNNNNITIVIAIDNSRSQGDKDGALNKTTKPIVRFLDNIYKNGNTSLNFGLVVWNDKIVEELSNNPVETPSIIKEKLSKIKTEGNTCVSFGLERANQMLANTSSANRRYILFFSNGNDEYCNRSDNLCNIAEQAQKTGITIYALGEINSNSSLNCISNKNNLFDLSKISLDSALDIIAAEILGTEPRDIFSKTGKPGKDLKITESLEAPFILTGRGDSITINETNTNVTISKSVIGGSSGPKIVFRIKAPEPRYIDKDILFAIDSSGSMKLENYEEEMKKAMIKVAEYLNNRNLGENINISILSWDNNIDFVYGSKFNKNIIDNNISNAKFVSVKNLSINELDQIMTKNFTCEETELTDFNIGLENSLNILDNDANKNNPHNMRMLIFIAGRSEFNPWTQKSLHDKNISRFAFGIGVEDGSRMDASLYNVSTLKDLGYRKTTRPLIQSTFKTYIMDLLGANKANPDLGDEIIKLLNIAINKDIVGDLVIEDSINPFLQIDKDSIQVNGKDENLINYIINQNRITLNVPGNLTPGSSTEISYDLKMNLTLPISGGSIGNKPVDLFLSEDQIKSSVKYKWQNDLKDYEIDIPTNYIKIY